MGTHPIFESDFDCLTEALPESKMADADINDQDLLDYDEEEQPAQKEAEKKDQKNVKGSYVSIHSSGFRDFLLKPELSKAIVDCGFEHPSQVQNECIPQAVTGMDVVCQAKSGMGKTAVFFGGMPIDKDKKTLKENCPHIVVGTPGRILGLIRSKALNLKHIKHFVLDECDKMLG